MTQFPYGMPAEDVDKAAILATRVTSIRSARSEAGRLATSVIDLVAEVRRLKANLADCKDTVYRITYRDDMGGSGP